MHSFSSKFVVSSLCILISGSCKTRSGGVELKEAWISLMDSKWKAVEEVSDRNEYIRTYDALPPRGGIKPLPWPYAARSGESPDLNHAVTASLYAEPSDRKTGSKAEAAIIKSSLVTFVAESSHSDNGVETRSLGGVCRLDSDSYRKSLEFRTASRRTVDHDQCFAVNAGAFHLATTNFVALRNLSFMIDPQVDQEFAHYPIASFISEALGLVVTSEENHTKLQIKNTVQYLLPSGKLKSTIYRYTLEMDEAGDIVDGEWLGKTVPQLIWMQNRPKFTAKDKALEELYIQSVSLPERLAKQDFSSLDLEDPSTPVGIDDALVINHKYRIELHGDIPRGADSLKIFLGAAFRSLGPVSIYRNTFADEDEVLSIEIQIHSAQTARGLMRALSNHSNGRSEIKRILR